MIFPYIATIVGHVGDGNFHTVLVFDNKSKEELETAQALAYRIAE